MDVKVTLSFDQSVINKAKKFADANNMSLSRLTEFLLSKVTSGHYKTLDEMPVASWVSMVAEGDIEYKTRNKSRKNLKQEYFNSKK